MTDFPDPDSPTMPSVSPGATSKDTFLTARTMPALVWKEALRFLTESMRRRRDDQSLRTRERAEKMTGMPGAVVATLGYITPSCIIVTIIAKLYLKYREMDMLQGILGGIRPAVVALIGSAGISILQTAFWEASGKMVISDTSWLMVGIFVVCVILLRKVKMNPIWVMVLAGVMKVLVAMAGKI